MMVDQRIVFTDFSVLFTIQLLLSLMTIVCGKFYHDDANVLFLFFFRNIMIPEEENTCRTKNMS